MDSLNNYAIPFRELSDGNHHFEFEVGGNFFAAFESGDIRAGKLEAVVELAKAAGGAQADVAIRGFVTVECDRCLEDCDLPVDYHATLLVRYASEPQESDGDVMWIAPGQDTLDLGQYIYESIVLSLPYQRVHGVDANGNSLCNRDMLERFRIVTGDEFERETAPKGETLEDKITNNNK